MKKIQKLMILGMLVTSSLSTAAPTPTLQTLDLVKNTGPQITTFINNYMTPQRPSVQNFGMLNLDFALSDIETAWKLKQAIDSTKVVVGRRQKRQWNKDLETNYGKFIDLTRITTQAERTALKGAYQGFNDWMNRTILRITDIKDFPINAQKFLNRLAIFVDVGGKEEPFEDLKTVAEATVAGHRTRSKATAKAARKAFKEKMRTDKAAIDARTAALNKKAAAIADKLKDLEALITTPEGDLEPEDYVDMDKLTTETEALLPDEILEALPKDTVPVPGDDYAKMLSGTLPSALLKAEEARFKTGMAAIFEKYDTKKTLPWTRPHAAVLSLPKSNYTLSPEPGKGSAAPRAGAPRAGAPRAGANAKVLAQRKATSLKAARLVDSLLRIAKKVK